MAIQNHSTATPPHGRYYAPANGSRLYSGGNQAAVATAFAAGLPTTYTGGLVLYNPLASTVQLAINEVKIAFILALTNVSLIGLGVGQSATALAGTLTAVPSQPQNVGSSIVAQGLLYSSASITLPVAPYLARALAVLDTGATSGGPTGAFTSYDIAGGIMLQPGAYCCFTSSAAGTAASFLGGFVWEETAIGSQ